jgi:hypothetical protein
MAVDRQITSMAGEFLVAGKLFKHGLQTSVTLGNAKSIDILAYHPETEKTFAVSVKSLRGKNCFPLRPDVVSETHTYVFVVLHNTGEEEEYFIVPGKDIKDAPASFFGSSLSYPDRAAVNYGPLKPYKDQWSHFDA